MISPKSLTSEQIEARMQQLDELLLIPMPTEDQTLGLLLEYIELDNEWDRRKSI